MAGTICWSSFEKSSDSLSDDLVLQMRQFNCINIYNSYFLFIGQQYSFVLLEKLLKEQRYHKKVTLQRKTQLVKHHFST